LPTVSVLQCPVIGSVSALRKFDADTVWRGDVTQEAAIDALFHLDRETGAFAAQLGAKRLEIVMVEKAEIIGPACVMTWKSL
jgi:hypothetical protein